MMKRAATAALIVAAALSAPEHVSVPADPETGKADFTSKP